MDEMWTGLINEAVAKGTNVEVDAADRAFTSPYDDLPVAKSWTHRAEELGQRAMRAGQWVWSNHLQYGMVAALVTFAIMAQLSPPMVQRHYDGETGRPLVTPERDWRLMALWAVFMAIIVVITPLFLRNATALFGLARHFRL